MRWNSDGERCWIEYEPDPRHAELIVNSLDLEGAKGVTTPSVKKRLEEVLATFPQYLRIADTLLSQCGEGSVLVARQTRFFVLSKGAARDVQKRTIRTAWAESLEGAMSGHQSWALLCRFRCRLLLAEIPKGVDRNSELKQRLHLWESGQISDLISKVLGQQELWAASQNSKRGAASDRRTAREPRPVP